MPWTGPRTKRSEVADYFRTLGANIVPEKNVDDIEALLVDGDHAVMLGRFTRVAKGTGRTFMTPIAMHLQVAGGKIVKLHLYEEGPADCEHDEFRRGGFLRGAGVGEPVRARGVSASDSSGEPWPGPSKRLRMVG
ncbi:nuclear transport factor 2 family protein [Streptomyces sp. NPDC058293]|uniref:nuclear transport factor 2 family protein n=1 Tax=Streptomyces sp. NPDC058293 TaxID=3346429 RepID=UPI0036E05F71